MVLHHVRFRFGPRRDNTMVWITVTVAATAALMWAWPQGLAVAVTYALSSALATILMFVVLIVASLLISLRSGRRRGTAVGYFDETATQIVHCRGSRWVLDKHFATHPGRHEVTTFRRRVFTHIMAEADRHNVTVAMSTRVPALRDHYLAEMPGLAVVACRHGFWQLERSPQHD